MVYDEYKFVTKQDVFELGCTNLIGTKMLKEYMHGYLMHLRLYNKVKAKLELINYKESRSQRITQAVEDELPKAIEDKEIVVDDRFTMMKGNPEFKVDKLSDAYIQRHPHMKKQLMK